MNQPLGLINKKILIISVLVVAVIGIFFLLFNMGVLKTSSSSSLQGVSAVDQRADINQPRFSVPLNQERTFSVKNNKGAEIGSVTYTIESAELRDEIIVKGRKALAVKGRTFLILNLKLRNDLNKELSIATKDFIRIAEDKENLEWLAPEIHNDPVSVQAVSTKYTRLGLPVDDVIKNFKLQLGEIGSQDKTAIDIKFN